MKEPLLCEDTSEAHGASSFWNYSSIWNLRTTELKASLELNRMFDMKFGKNCIHLTPSKGDLDTFEFTTDRWEFNDEL